MTTAFIPFESLRGPGPATSAAAVESRTPAPWMHLVPGSRPLVFVVDGSRLYEVSPELFAGPGRDETSLRQFQEAVGGNGPGYDRRAPISPSRSRFR